MFVRKIADVEDKDYGGGIRKRLLVGPNEGARNFIMRYFEILPGAEGHSQHTHNWEHEGVILSGEGVILSGDRRMKVGEGEFYFVAPNELHTLRNTGKEPLRFACGAPLCAYNALNDPNAEW